MSFKNTEIYIFNLLVCLLLLISSLLSAQSLDLKTAIQKSLESNYGIRIAGMEQSQAEINNNWGNAGRYPTITFSGTAANQYSLTNDGWNSNNANMDLGMSWILFNGFKTTINKDRLSSYEDLAKGNTAVLVENTIQDVIMGYNAILLEKEKLNVLKEVMGLSSDRYQYELKRQELGSSVTYQVLQAKNNYLSDKVDYLNGEIALRNAYRNLNFLMGIDSMVNWTYVEEFRADTQIYDFQILRDKMLDGNNALKNNYIGLKLREYETGLAKGNMYPSVTFSGGLNDTYPYNTDNNSSPNIDNSMGAYANLSLRYNLFSGGIRRKAIQVAKIEESIAQVGIEEMEHILSNQLMNVLDRYEVRKEILNLTKENMETAAMNLKIAEEKYRSGAINSFNFRDLQLIYINAAISKYVATYNLVESQTELVRLIGGLLSEGNQ